VELECPANDLRASDGIKLKIAACFSTFAESFAAVIDPQVLCASCSPGENAHNRLNPSDFQAGKLYYCTAFPQFSVEIAVAMVCLKGPRILLRAS